jgi:hypothetical protein
MLVGDSSGVVLPASSAFLTRCSASLGACSTAKLSALAGSTLSTLSTAAKTGAARVAESSRDLSKKVQEAHISDKLSTGLEKVKATVADPELMTKVQTGASSLWAKSVVTAGSWWSSAKTLAAEVMAEPGPAAPAAGGSRNGEDASAVAMGGLPPAVAGLPGASESLGRQPSRDSGAAGSSAVTAAAGAPVPSRRTDDDDDAAWLAAQVASAQARDPALAAVASSGGARRTGAAAGSAEWEGAGWEAGLGEEGDAMGAAMGAGSIAQPHPAVASAAAGPAAKAAAASSSAASAFDLSDIDAVLAGAATAPPAKPVAASPAPAPSAAAGGVAPGGGGDFFSAWGVS